MHLQKCAKVSKTWHSKNKKINELIDKYNKYIKKIKNVLKNSHLIWELASVFHTLVGGVAPQLVRSLHTHTRTQLPQYEPFIRAAEGWAF